VHQSSTDAASSLLVTALNEGRDVIMDGTLSWQPFVVQTITMARNVHRRRYRMGAGYRVNGDGTVNEIYWERIENEEPEQVGGKKRKPYRIELVGVVCDAYLAVIRGIRYITDYYICFGGLTLSNCNFLNKFGFLFWYLMHQSGFSACKQESYHV
jgi:hypothetical protein